MNEKKIYAELRTETGKNECHRLRKNGFIPAVLYSHGESETIKVKKNSFFKLFKNHISESIIFDVSIAGKDKELLAFVKDYTSHPISGEILHLDLFKVTRGEKIHTFVPIELVGNPIGAKVGGILESSEREIQIECLPKDLPEKIEIDVSNLNVNEYIHAKDIKLADSIKLLSNPEAVIAGVLVPRIAEEAEEVSEEGEAPEGEAAEESEE